MKRDLVIGVGGELMGDDAIGVRVAGQLALDANVRATVDVIADGTDLFRYAGEMRGRRRVLLIDANLDENARPGTVTVQDSRCSAETGRSAHQLSLVDSVRLLELTEPDLENVCFTFVLIAIPRAAAGTALSPELERCLPQIVDAVLRMLNA